MEETNHQIAGTMSASKVVLITGATDGIGQHTALKFTTAPEYQQDSLKLLLHGRNAARLESTVQRIQSVNPNVQTITYCYDLSSIAQTIAFTEAVMRDNDRLDILVNNAGVYESTYRESHDGYEMTYAVNVIASFIIANNLLPLLKRTPHSRMLNVSSISQEDGRGQLKLCTDSILSSKSKKTYNSYTAYGTSKLLVAAWSYELSRHISADDCLVMSCDPGTVTTKMLDAGWPGYNGPELVTVENANDEYILVTSPFDPTLHGKYFVATEEARCEDEVYDDEVRNRLWSELQSALSK